MLFGCKVFKHEPVGGFMDASVVLSVVASVISLITFVFYNRGVLKGQIGSVVMTWCLWSVITTINVSSYWSMNQDLYKVLVALTDWGCCLITTGILLVRGYGSILVNLDKLQKIATGISALSIVAWAMSSSAKSGNMTLQAAYIAAFLSMWLGLWKEPKRESWVCWFVWAGAYGLGLVVVVLRWRGHWEDLVSPVLYVVTHIATAALAARKPK